MSQALRLYLKVTPKARKASVGGRAASAEGDEPRLMVRVSQAPDGGDANAAVVAALAKALDVPKSALSIVQGATGRLKTIALDSDAATQGRALLRFQDLMNQNLTNKEMHDGSDAD